MSVWDHGSWWGTSTHRGIPYGYGYHHIYIIVIVALSVAPPTKRIKSLDVKKTQDLEQEVINIYIYIFIYNHIYIDRLRINLYGKK